jgi:hypothetical protein
MSDITVSLADKLSNSQQGEVTHIVIYKNGSTSPTQAQQAQPAEQSDILLDLKSQIDSLRMRLRYLEESVLLQHESTKASPYFGSVQGSLSGLEVRRNGNATSLSVAPSTTPIRTVFEHLVGTVGESMSEKEFRLDPPSSGPPLLAPVRVTDSQKEEMDSKFLMCEKEGDETWVKVVPAGVADFADGIPNLEEAEEEAEDEEAEDDVVMEEDGEAEEAEDGEAEEEEEAAMELTEFEYKGTTYYRDDENQVYKIDSDGDLDDTPVGVWNEAKSKILWYPKD